MLNMHYFQSSLNHLNMIVREFTYYSSLRRVRMKAQWLERRSGSLPWSLTSIQLSAFNSEIRQLHEIIYHTKRVG